MKIMQTAKNGVVVMAIKSFEELDDVELDSLVFPAGHDANDFENYQVRYNKQGMLLGVQPHDLVTTEETSYDLISFMNLAYGDKKQFVIAKKQFEDDKGRKFDMTQKQVQRVVEATHES